MEVWQDGKLSMSKSWVMLHVIVGKAICCRTSEEVLSPDFEKLSFEASAEIKPSKTARQRAQANSKRLVGVATAKRNSFATTVRFIFPNTPFFQVQLQDTCSFAATSYRESSKGHIQNRVQRVQRVHSCLMYFDVTFTLWKKRPRSPLHDRASNITHHTHHSVDVWIQGEKQKPFDPHLMGCAWLDAQAYSQPLHGQTVQTYEEWWKMYRPGKRKQREAITEHEICRLVQISSDYNNES